MPRFYFDSRYGDDFTEDDIGVDFLTIDQATKAAMRALAEMYFELAPSAARRVLSIEVRDNHGPLIEARLMYEVRMLRT